MNVVSFSPVLCRLSVENSHELPLCALMAMGCDLVRLLPESATDINSGMGRLLLHTVPTMRSVTAAYIVLIILEAFVASSPVPTQTPSQESRIHDHTLPLFPLAPSEDLRTSISHSNNQLRPSLDEAPFLTLNHGVPNGSNEQHHILSLPGGEIASSLQALPLRSRLIQRPSVFVIGGQSYKSGNQGPWSTKGAYVIE